MQITYTRGTAQTTKEIYCGSPLLFGHMSHAKECRNKNSVTESAFFFIVFGLRDMGFRILFWVCILLHFTRTALVHGTRKGVIEGVSQSHFNE